MIKELWTRRSIRSFKDTPIKDEDLRTILSAGLKATSAVANYPLELVVIKNAETKAKIAGFYEFSGFCVQSPLSVLVCYDKDKRTSYFKDSDFGPLDASAAVQNMLLAATALNIGSCWTHALLSVEAYQTLLNLPKNIIPVALVVLGYTDKTFEHQDRYDEAKIHHDKW